MKNKNIAIFIVAAALVVFGVKLFGGARGTESEAALYYKERAEALESELAVLKTEQYAVVAAYRAQVESLEDELSQSRGAYLYTVTDGKVTLTGYNGNDRQLMLPSELDGMPVTAIGKECFKNTALESVILPASITKIDWFAFFGCSNLKSIAIPPSVERIEYGSFDGCPSLTVYCEKGSFAEQYAKSYGIRTVSE